MKRYLRRLFPEAGLPYELFDAAVFVGTLAALWYVFTEPSDTTRAALSDTLSRILEPRLWGVILLVVGVVAWCLAYGRWRTVRAGYLLLAAITGMWSASLVLGVVVAMPPWDLAGKSLGSALVFGWVCRRMIADADRAGDSPALPAEPPGKETRE